MAIFIKSRERAPTTPISISPTGATLGPAAHLLVWGKFGNTYAHDPAFHSLNYYNGGRWNGQPSNQTLTYAVPCITPNMYPEWDKFNIENFVMGNDSGFGIGTRYVNYQNGCKLSGLENFDVGTSQKLLIFINKSGFTYSNPSLNNIVNPPSFINDYLNYYKYTESLYYNRFSSETMFPFYYIINDPEYKLKDLTNYDLLAAGTYHFMMGYGNTLYAWGENSNNQCNIPANATSTINLKQITAGNAHSLALYYTANKGSTIIGWGSNSNGQITIPSSIGTGAIQIASGFDHNLALSATGGVVCWGNNSYNQCDIPVGLSGITFIAAGHYHSMAIKTDGTVYCWGLNTSGQCNIPNGTTNGFRIDGGLEHTVLLKKDGSVSAWGGNTFYQTTLPDCPGNTLFNNNAYAEMDCKHRNNWAVNIPNSVRDIRCGKYSSIALHTGIILWYHKVITGADYRPTGRYLTYLNNIENRGSNQYYIKGLTNNSNFPGCTATHKLSMVSNSKRYDIYDYDDTIPIYPPDVNIPYSESRGSRWPIKRNGSFYNTSSYGQGNSVGNTGCWSFGYGDDGIFRSYDYFAPPDFSGVGLRPRRCSNANLFWGSSGEPSFSRFGQSLFGDYYTDYNYGSDFNFYNSGGIPCILISKKHFVICQHWAYPHIYWEQQFMRRDGKTFNVAGNLVSRLSNGVGAFPDLMLFEMQKELDPDDAQNIAIYNKWADYSGFTGTQMIDPQAVVLKGITAGITSGSAIITSAIGRRIWAIDANDRAYSGRVQSVNRNVTGSNRGYYLNFIQASPSMYEPLNCYNYVYVGDSGTPWFITGRGHTYHASYDASLGITLQPTIFLGTDTFARTPLYVENNIYLDGTNSFMDYGATFSATDNPQFLTKSPIQVINEYLIAAGQQPIEQIPIDVGNPPWPPYIIPVAGACANPNEIVTSLNIDPNSLFSNLKNSPTGNEIIGTASVESIDGNILTLSGISGTFIISNDQNSYSIAGGTAGAAYNKINPFTTPLNNGLGTTAGVGSILNNEAAGYTFDSNDPFEIFNG